MRYPKINSLFKRDGESKKFIFGDYAQAEFDIIKQWRVVEKIDGMNIRIFIEKTGEDTYKTTFKGRNEDSMLPQNLVEHLITIIKPSVIISAMNSIDPINKIILFGEGYGPKIQSGGNYRDDVGFILFDVWGGHRWSSRDEVKQLALFLGIPVPHDYGMMTEQEIINLVAGRPLSPTAIRPMIFEGVIARSEPLLRNNYTGDPLMFKLKCKDI